jgi:hypothetical protein
MESGVPNRNDPTGKLILQNPLEHPPRKGDVLVDKELHDALIDASKLFAGIHIVSEGGEPSTVERGCTGFKAYRAEYEGSPDGGVNDRQERLSIKLGDEIVDALKADPRFTTGMNGKLFGSSTGAYGHIVGLKPEDGSVLNELSLIRQPRENNVGMAGLYSYFSDVANDMTALLKAEMHQQKLGQNSASDQHTCFDERNQWVNNLYVLVSNYVAERLASELHLQGTVSGFNGLSKFKDDTMWDNLVPMHTDGKGVFNRSYSVTPVLQHDSTLKVLLQIYNFAGGELRVVVTNATWREKNA